MRIMLFYLSVATLLAAMCADIAEVTAAPQSQDRRAPLIERMTRDRKPASSTPSTSHLEKQADHVAPVRRVPVSHMRVEVGSTQVAGPPPRSATPTLAVREPTPATRKSAPQARPTSTPASQLETIVPPRPAAIDTEQPQLQSTAAGPTNPPPTLSAVPEITFDPLHDELTLALPDTTNDGFIGVPRSQRNAYGQPSQAIGDFYHQPQSAPPQQQRRRPSFRRRFR
jgi:hypothetical protein